MPEPTEPTSMPGSPSSSSMQGLSERGFRQRDTAALNHPARKPSRMPKPGGAGGSRYGMIGTST